MTTDNQTLEDILDICLDRLQRGDSVQACLEEYPEHADELAPILETAEMLRPREVVPPIMSAKAYHANSARLFERAAELRNSKAHTDVPESEGLISALAALLLGPSRRLALTAMALLVLLAVIGTGTVAASSDSLPGSTLYPVKRTAETVWAAFPRSSEAQTRVHLQLADRRLQEMERLLAQGRVDEDLAVAMERELELARTSANAAGDDALRQVLAQTEEHTRVLSQLQAGAPAGAQEQVQQLRAATARIGRQVREDLGDSPGDSEPADGETAPGQDKRRGPPEDLPVEPPPGVGPPIDPGPPADAGPPPDTGPPEDPGPPDELPVEPPTVGPPEDLGPPDDVGPPPDTGPPEDPGPPDDVGPPPDTGPPDDSSGPPNDAGPPPDTGPPEDPGPPDDAGPPPDTGPPDDPGPPDDAGPPPDTGPPENSGPPDNPGRPNNPGPSDSDDGNDDNDDDNDDNSESKGEGKGGEK